MRSLTVDDLSSFLAEPVVAVLATFRRDGSVLLSPIWHEWRDGGFNLWVGRDNAKTKHLRRDPRTTIVVAESGIPLRGVEVRGVAQFVEQGAAETARRIAVRYLGEEVGAAYTANANDEDDVVVRIEPGHVRAWDFADEYDAPAT